MGILYITLGACPPPLILFILFIIRCVVDRHFLCVLSFYFFPVCGLVCTERQIRDVIRDDCVCRFVIERLVLLTGRSGATMVVGLCMEVRENEELD